MKVEMTMLEYKRLEEKVKKLDEISNIMEDICKSCEYSDPHETVSDMPVLQITRMDSFSADLLRLSRCMCS